MATFDRRLEGPRDHLVGYKSGWLEINDSTVIRASGETRHLVATFTGRSTDLVLGTAFGVTTKELLHADAYEVSDYKREYLSLASGRNAWVFVDARDESPWPPRHERCLAQREEES